MICTESDPALMGAALAIANGPRPGKDLETFFAESYLNMTLALDGQGDIKKAAGDMAAAALLIYDEA